MRSPTLLTGPFEGRFEGHGQWHDIAGDAGAYTVTQTLAATPSGFDLAFTHLFPEDPDVNAAYAMEALTEHVFAVTVGGKPLGHGHIAQDALQFYIRLGELVVESTTRVAPTGLIVSGFSTSNAKGLFTAWTEALTRVSHTHKVSG